MALTVWGDRFETSELTDTSKRLRFQLPFNAEIKYVRPTFIFVDNPTFTDLSAKIYTDDGGSPTPAPELLLATSATQAKANILTDNSGWLNFWLKFDTPVSLSKNIIYNVVINATGYTATSTSYIAWARDALDQVYGDEPDNFISLPSATFRCEIIGARQ